MALNKSDSAVRSQMPTIVPSGETLGATVEGDGERIDGACRQLRGADLI